MDPDYSKPETVEKAPDEWANVFSQLPRIDAVFVPGGDPGHTDPRVLLPFLEKQTENLHRFHPQAPRCGCRRRASIRSGSTHSTTF